MNVLVMSSAPYLTNRKPHEGVDKKYLDMLTRTFNMEARITFGKKFDSAVKAAGT